MKKIIFAIVVILLVVFGIYWFTNMSKSVTVEPAKETVNQVATTTPANENKPETVIGTSVGGRSIKAYHFGTGTKEVLFVGGVHGGYAWNTSAVAYELINYLKANPNAVPASVKVTVVPVLNPDGLSKVVANVDGFTAADVKATEATKVAGRFNGNNVDLNRNFDCDWNASAVWQNKKVSGGSAAFSEPESLAIKNYIETKLPKAVVVWYSAAGGVFASNCHTGIPAETKTLTNLFAKASGYPAYEEFNFYETTGDMTNWLAKKGIAAISVLLTTHDSVEWSKNKLGVEAILNYFAK